MKYFTNYLINYERIYVMNYQYWIFRFILEFEGIFCESAASYLRTKTVGMFILKSNIRNIQYSGLYKSKHKLGYPS